MLKEKFQKRFDELDESFKKIPFRNYDSGISGSYVELQYWNKWGTSALNLIKAVFGENSPHYEHFLSSYNNCGGGDNSVRGLYGLFSSAKEDFEGGYVFNIDLRVSGEVLGDFVSMAKHSLQEGYKDVAIVLACAALEDTLKKYASLNGIDTSTSSLTEVINSLKSKGLVSGAQKSLLTTMPKIRNLAMHAEWDKISAPDVSSVIGFVEQFLLSNFSD